MEGFAGHYTSATHHGDLSHDEKCHRTLRNRIHRDIEEPIYCQKQRTSIGDEVNTFFH